MIVDLRQDSDLEQLLDRSQTNPIFVFKHSTQCSISTQAYEEFIDFVEGVPGLICGTVLVIENRKLSNAIAERFGVRHQSPQAREPGGPRVGVRGFEQRARTLRHHACLGQEFHDRFERFGDVGLVRVNIARM